jgi:hypothetical protein
MIFPFLCGLAVACGISALTENDALGVLVSCAVFAAAAYQSNEWYKEITKK